MTTIAERMADAAIALLSHPSALLWLGVASVMAWYAGRGAKA